MQGDAEEDDCYADIMQDDIIKLDENPRPWRVADEGQQNKAVLPCQGTANRRLRLRRHRNSETQDISIEDPQHSLIDKLSSTRMGVPFVFLAALMLTLLLLLLLMHGSCATHP